MGSHDQRTLDEEPAMDTFGRGSDDQDAIPESGVWERADLGDEPSTGGPPCATLLKLIVDAAEALDDDRDVARVLLRRVATMLRSGPRGPKARPAAGPALAPWQAKRVVSHINDNLDRTLRLGELARVAGLSSSHFSRAFKGAFEQTPHAFIVLRRVERARQELLAGQEPLSQIALSCGFADQAHLARIFRRATGLAPSAWRRANRPVPRGGGGLASGAAAARSAHGGAR